MKRLLTIIGFLTWWGLLYASNPDGRDAEEALAQIDNQIAQYHQKGDTEKESEARWQKIQTLKNFSMTEKQAEEALIQMEWFRNNQQWDNYYRSWQLRSNALSAMGKLQLALQETQRMLSDAKERNNKLGHAMAYKQIGVIYLNMKQTEPAVDALQHYAELMKDEESDISSLSNIYYRMAKAYDYDEAYDKELQVTNDWQRFLREKVGLRTDPEARECYNAWYLAKAAAYIGLKQFENAREALDSASYHAHLINTSLSLHHTYKMQARYYLARGDAANALLYTDSVRLVTNEKDDHTSEIRAQALMMLDRGSEAAEIYQRLYHEKDSVFGRDARQHLDELNTLFQIDELKTEQQRTKFRYTLIAASSIVLALVVLLIFGRRNTIRQKKVNEQLRIANERAIVSSKMKTEFIRNISHEIRTPLNIVSGFTQILTSPDMELPAGSKRDIQERVTENTDRITKLVDRMLELSDVNNETLIDRNDQTNALNIVSQAIDYSGIALHTRPGNADAAVVFNTLDNEELASSEALLTNSRYAVHALAQLLENAVKFTKEGSITLRMTSSGTKVCFSVEDTGIGIPADQTEHIFEEFVQLNEFADGAGIGLTVARSIAQRMGGNLWLDTDYTQGARFVLELLK
ncbi:sensor histidine kinase [Prevotella sp. ne3005]|uniref:sensor histidine kinase n=1 Tax=Prevotella sp. ne3005 TaxID=1761887 RepID=UPI000B879CF2|nr:HAMP domain-containing sensor histidine kinase [Prevotella sp. ne3005]